MISVIVPAYNEEEPISGTISSIHGVLKGAGYENYEIIVVDDGSSDDTAKLAEDTGVKVIRKLQNIGYGHSLKTGIYEASYDTIVITDADGTYPIEKIPELLDLYKEGYNMVVGARTGPHYRESIIKMPLRQILKWLVEFTAGRKIPDINSGLRVFSKKEAMPFFKNLSDSFSFTTSITLAYMLKKKFVKYIPIPYYKRVGSTKVRLFRDSVRVLQYIVLAILYYNPMKIYLVIAIIAALAGLAGTALGVLLSNERAYWASFIGLMTAFLIFSMGLLADLLKQIMDRLDEANETNGKSS